MLGDVQETENTSAKEGQGELLPTPVSELGLSVGGSTVIQLYRRSLLAVVETAPGAEADCVHFWTGRQAQLPPERRGAGTAGITTVVRQRYEPKLASRQFAGQQLEFPVGRRLRATASKCTWWWCGRRTIHRQGRQRHGRGRDGAAGRLLKLIDPTRWPKAVQTKPHPGGALRKA